MLNAITRNQLVACWFAAVALTGAGFVAIGVHPGLSTGAFLLALSVVPPGMIVALWRDKQPSTAREILYATDAGTEGRS